MNKTNLDKAIKLRHHLHMYPELSEQEYKTREALIDFLKENTSLEVVDRGRWLYAKYTAAEKKKPYPRLKVSIFQHLNCLLMGQQKR